MRTNIIIDDELMTDVLKLTGIKSKREALEQGLRILLALKQQEKIKHKKVCCVGRPSGAVMV
jgi:Arc/MetJ family transcription regulator